MSTILTISSGIVTAQNAGSDMGPMDRREEGDWVVECLGGSDDPLDCQLYQRVLTGDSSTVAMVVTFAWDVASEGYSTQIALPLGVLLTRPPLLAIDQDYRAELLWSRCTSGGCLVEGVPGPDMIDRLLAATSASIVVVHPEDGEIAIPVSLDGFSEAIAHVTPLATEP